MLSLSRPKIAIHKNTSVMKTTEKTVYFKRTQKVDSLSFKLYVVHEIEDGLVSRVQA